MEKSDRLFVKGGRGGPGRPPGVKDARTKRGEELARLFIDKHFTKIVQDCLTCEDPKVKLEILKFFYEHAYGKARLRGDGENASKRVTIRFDLAGSRGAERLAAAERIDDAVDAELADDGDGRGDRACLPPASGEPGSAGVP